MHCHITWLHRQLAWPLQPYGKLTKHVSSTKFQNMEIGWQFPLQKQNRNNKTMPAGTIICNKIKFRLSLLLNFCFDIGSINSNNACKLLFKIKKF